MGLPCSSAHEESACNAGDLGLILALGRSHGEGKVYPLQYFGLENSMDCIVSGVSKSQRHNRATFIYFESPWASLVTQMVKNLPAMRETWVQSLVWGDPLDKG